MVVGILHSFRSVVCLHYKTLWFLKHSSSCTDFESAGPFAPNLLFLHIIEATGAKYIDLASAGICGKEKSNIFLAFPHNKEESIVPSFQLLTSNSRFERTESLLDHNNQIIF